MSLFEDVTLGALLPTTSTTSSILPLDPSLRTEDVAMLASPGPGVPTAVDGLGMTDLELVLNAHFYHFPHYVANIR
jgi:hypothetical protein